MPSPATIDDNPLRSPPRIHPPPTPTPPPTSLLSPPTPSPPHSRSIELPSPADDGWVYSPPSNLPLTSIDAMALATSNQLHLVDMTDTFKMMTRGQTFTSYITVMDKTGHHTSIQKKTIFLFFNKCQCNCSSLCAYSAAVRCA